MQADVPAHVVHRAVLPRIVDAVSDKLVPDQGKRTDLAPGNRVQPFAEDVPAVVQSPLVDAGYQPGDKKADGRRYRNQKKNKEKEPVGSGLVSRRFAGYQLIEQDTEHDRHGEHNDSPDPELAELLRFLKKCGGPVRLRFHGILPVWLGPVYGPIRKRVAGKAVQTIYRSIKNRSPDLYPSTVQLRYDRVEAEFFSHIFIQC